MNVNKDPIFTFEDLNIKDTSPVISRRPIESEKLKSIYQQAYIYDLLYSFAKEHLPHIENVKKEEKAILENVKATDTTVDSIKEKVIEYLFNLNVDKKESETTSTKTASETRNETNIWNIQEINILRRNFASIKETNAKLTSMTRVLQEENLKYKESIDKFYLENQKFRDEKLTLEKENERLYIRIQDLEKLYYIHSNEVDLINKEKHELLESVSKQNKNNQDLINQKSKLEYELNKKQLKLDSIKNEFKLHYSNQLDNIKINYAKEISKLNEQITLSDEKYKNKKAENLKMRKALDLLRSHYMQGPNNQNKISDDLIKIL